MDDVWCSGKNMVICFDVAAPWVWKWTSCALFYLNRIEHAIYNCIIWRNMIQPFCCHKQAPTFEPWEGCRKGIADSMQDPPGWANLDKSCPGAFWATYLPEVWACFVSGFRLPVIIKVTSTCWLQCCSCPPELSVDLWIFQRPCNHEIAALLPNSWPTDPHWGVIRCGMNMMFASNGSYKVWGQFSKFHRAQVKMLPQDFLHSSRACTLIGWTETL